MSHGAEVSSGNVNRHPTVVVKFKSRSECRNQRQNEWDPGSVSTVRTSMWWSHGKQPDRQEAWDTVV